MAGILVFAMLFFWYVRWFFIRAPERLDLREEGAFFTGMFLYFLLYPEDVAAGLVLASLVPTTVAIIKFALAVQLGRGVAADGPLARSSLAALWGTVFAAVQLAASIATLILFFR